MRSVVNYLTSAHSAMAEIQPGMVNWEEVFQGAEWFHWTGITPAISQSSADVCLEAVKAASKLGLKISTDLNYRAKLWKYGGDREKIMTELTSYCDVILETKKMRKCISESNSKVLTLPNTDTM